MERVPENINFPEEEEKILEYWKKERCFEKCLQQSKKKPKYTFYDGPPFATGLPHYGHILAGTIKDVVTRYAHQQGYHVDRRFGWDCHGLPIEYEIDKVLGIRSPEDILKLGIKNYNDECRKIVMRYANEWEQIIGRMGRWIDFKNDYKTLYPTYMETLWWIFKQLYQKGLVYKGVKVMPYSTACTTPLSNFESGQNYKEVQDPAVTVTFPIVDDPDKAVMIGWTTTPWTLPSNLSLCVHPDLEYVRVKEVSTGRVIILMEARLEAVFKSAKSYEILERFPGKKLAGLRYQPLFDYFLKYKDVAFRVLLDDYVTEESGTGVVHQAPYFGEDDYRVCLANGVITRDQEIICPVDASGRFTDEVKDFRGQYVKDADKNIIAMLKKTGRLYHAGTMKHSYPFCWRSDTPLIYKAVPSWFIRVEHMPDRLLNASSHTYWVPDFVKEKRFGNWLRNARDWAVSRNRYWGTPIPIWLNDDGEIVVIGSIEELYQESGVRVTDLHREVVDGIEIPSKKPGGKPLRRIDEVFDCWFESGSMPFAQLHYPFENADDFDMRFPADFIAEGIDQTRGWFYTLLVISTALFDKAPFKNLIANGLVLAADGQKMSKRKKNYPDPMEVVHKYGADALRLYLINSPVVRAENLRFKEDGVRDIVKDVFLPWYNAFRFLYQNIERLRKEDGVEFAYDSTRKADNVMDIWIVSYKESLLEFVASEMKAYRLYTVVPRLTKFIDQLTNWYVRLNRRRLKGELGKEDCLISLNTLYDILVTMVKMMAPFTPFLTDFMYLKLKDLSPEEQGESVHYQMMPVANRTRIDRKIEQSVSNMQSVIELGRILRDRKTIPVKYPLPEIVIIHPNEEYLEDIKSLEEFIVGELNVRKMILSSDREKYGVSMKAEPDFKALGQRLKTDFKEVTQAIRQLTDQEIQEGIKREFFEISKHRIEVDELRFLVQVAENHNQEQRYEAQTDNNVLILLDTNPSAELQEEGLAREIINRVQKLKKKAHLVQTDQVLVFYSILRDPEGTVEKVAREHNKFIEAAIKSKFAMDDLTAPNQFPEIISESSDIKGAQLMLRIVNPSGEYQPPSTKVQLVGFRSRYGPSRDTATIFVQNAKRETISLERLREEIAIAFGLYGLPFKVRFGGKDLVDPLAASGKILSLLRELCVCTQEMTQYPEGVPEGDDLSTESVEVLRERLNTMKQIMSDRKAQQTKNPRDDFWTKPQKCGSGIIDGTFLSIAFGGALCVIVTVSIYAFYNLYHAILKKFPSHHTEL
uniref:Isoleucine--tRNA ligase, cytoplasmic n=2 Tax=Lutzomyia longipalpis TaxID=7200 RepID=A0A1B0CA15_LUTLO